MARFETDGLEKLIADMRAAGESLSGPVADKMLIAGAEQVKQAWKNSARKHGLKDTGDMIDSIGFAEKPKYVYGIRSIDIYPQGTDRKGVRNAEKAFLLHYGWSDFPGGTHWVDDADRECDTTVIPAMAAVFDEEMKKKGLT